MNKAVSFQSVSQDLPTKLWLEPRKWQHRVIRLFQRPSYLDGGVQRGLVKLLELRSDVQQVNLRPTHHDSGQSRLVSSAALKTSCAHFNFTPNSEALKIYTFTFMLLYRSSAKKLGTLFTHFTEKREHR